MSGILQIPMQVPGMVGVFPQFKFMLTTDNLATVTAAGYLNNVSGEANPVSSTDIIQCIYGFNQQTGVGTYALFTVTITNGSIQLVQWAGDSGVVVPTIVGHIATYVDTNGTISEDAATAINGGNIQAGLSTGTAGTLISMPATGSKGAFVIQAIANTGNTITTLANQAMGQASIITIPDPANVLGRLLVGAGATPFVSGNFPKNSGTGGLMVDSGIAVSALAQTANVVLLTPTGNQTITAHNLIIGNGNLQAGVSGAAGTVASFPAAATKGSLILAAVANTGNTTTTISNAAMGQASVISIPDPGAATADFAVAPAALVNGNLIEASGTAGLIADAGVSVASVSSAITQLGQLYQVSVTFSPAQMVTAYDTPLTIVATPGATKMIQVVSASVYTASTGNTAYATGTAPIIQYGTSAHGAGTSAVGAGLVAGDITAATSQVRTLGPIASSALTGTSNQAITFSNATADYTGGTGTNITITLVYQLLTATV